MTARILTYILLAIVAVILIVSGSTVYYIGVYQPNQLHAQATATSVAATSSVAHMNATGTAQVKGTAQAQASATNYANAQATSMVVGTQIALQNVYNQATGGTPVFKDSMTTQDNNWSDGSYVDGSGNQVGSCGFTGGGYDVQTTVSFIQPCLSKGASFDNSTYQIQMKIVHGHSAGIVFRADTNDNGYYFRISTDGRYLFWKGAVVNSRYQEVSLASGESSAITTGNNQVNTLTVIERGSNFYLYVNQHYIDSATDASYKSGLIGFYVDSDAAGTEALFQNAEVWKA